MALTNYPNGVGSFGMPLIGTTTGNVFFVDDSGSNANAGTNADVPFADIDYAIGRCTANHGDIIFVMPGHTEDIAAAAGIALDVAGVSIIGLGSGSDRPTITFSATDSTMTITAASCLIQNIVFEAAIADVVTALSLSGAADHTSLIAIESYEGSVAGTYNFVDVITMATGCDWLTVKDSVFVGNDVNNDSFITGVAHQGLIVENCIFYANLAQAVSVTGLIDTSGNATFVRIKNCDFRSNIDGALFLDFEGAANTGTVSYCNFSSLDVAGAVTAGFDFAGIHFFECYVAGEADSWGIVGGGTVYS